MIYKNLNISLLIFLIIVSLVNCQSGQEVNKKTQQPVLKRQNTISNQNQTEITDEKELSGKIKIYVNKLNSTATVSEQSFGKNQLIKLGKKAVPYLEDYLKNDKRVFVKVQIVFVLEKIKDKSVISILEKTATGKYIALNKSAIIAIGNIGGDKAVSALKRLKKKVSENEIFVQIIDKSIEKAKK